MQLLTGGICVERSELIDRHRSKALHVIVSDAEDECHCTYVVEVGRYGECDVVD
jgi:hypothetical protein